MKTKTFFATLLAMFGLCAQAQITYTISQTCEDNGKLYDLRPNQGNPTTSGGGSENGHEYVDLGLSVKWATCNVGASKPEEYGNYYAWGETASRAYYNGWYAYKWGSGENNIIQVSQVLNLPVRRDIMPINV